ncbi:MAG: phosphogluconate dehydratase [Gammaproteobacteria bacterium]|nr:phosphogluconate dehydratase [Gammaproteobacteria bacterium]MDH5302656.1 phosphogluconate dehydratase [Gammaproteobacteria bacterium]MDH5320907.1 phosphogluconate dehydratase [Gammaproteobacteria bacterium]
MNTVIERVTQRIRQRSKLTRSRYLARVNASASDGPARKSLTCGNLAHATAASRKRDKARLAASTRANIGIVTAYNDMLSAHQPFEQYPALIKKAAAEHGAVAQVAGGVPAMCDGVTQGQDGMDLSLFSRDVIAMSTAIALSHNMFDAAACLGVCDKIVPGLLIGALSFGHLPVVFIPAGPMVSGLPNKEKARIREEYAAGKIGRDELLEAESASYHSPGTCTFYGTANSNQMLMEFMGLQLPGGSFVNPGTELRAQLTAEAVRVILGNTDLGENYLPIAHIVDEKAIVNAIVGLLATGGSTNHTLHLVAIAAAAGICIDWNDFDELSAAVPLLAQVYPNGMADVNHFHAAGGLGFLIGELLDAGYLHEDVNTILGAGLRRYCQEPTLANGRIGWQPAVTKSLNEEVVRPVARPFDSEGGLRVVAGNLGRAIVKVSAVEERYRRISAPARVFASQSAFTEAFNEGELERDFVAVLPWQGASANGMPELHKLTPYLGVLQNRGFKVALLTDGRMSGASGKVLAAIQVSPEAKCGGVIGKIRDGDRIDIDAASGTMSVTSGDDPLQRVVAGVERSADHTGMGRELFALFRGAVSGAEAGASVLVGQFGAYSK